MTNTHLQYQHVDGQFRIHTYSTNMSMGSGASTLTAPTCRWAVAHTYLQHQHTDRQWRIHTYSTNMSTRSGAYTLTVPFNFTNMSMSSGADTYSTNMSMGSAAYILTAPTCRWAVAHTHFQHQHVDGKWPIHAYSTNMLMGSGAYTLTAPTY